MFGNEAPGVWGQIAIDLIQNTELANEMQKNPFIEELPIYQPKNMKKTMTSQAQKLFI